MKVNENMDIRMSYNGIRKCVTILKEMLSEDYNNIDLVSLRITLSIMLENMKFLTHLTHNCNQLSDVVNFIINNSSRMLYSSVLNKYDILILTIIISQVDAIRLTDFINSHA